jgi:hypothetical protein
LAAKLKALAASIKPTWSPGTRPEHGVLAVKRASSDVEIFR